MKKKKTRKKNRRNEKNTKYKQHSHTYIMFYTNKGTYWIKEEKKNIQVMKNDTLNYSNKKNRKKERKKKIVSV